MDKKIVYINSIAVALLAVAATLSGLFMKNLYKHDTNSIVSQMMGQDIVTLLVAVPLLLISIYLIHGNSMRGRLIWMGTLFYFTYTYASMSFLASYNQLFLVYVAIFSISMYTLLGELVTTKFTGLKSKFNPGKLTKITASFLIFIALMLSLMWLKLIIDSIITGTAPAALEGYTTLVIQALDLGVLVPFAIISAVLLLKNNEWGYILTSIFLIKATLIGTAILSMIVFMVLNGVYVDPGQIIIFTTMTILGILVAFGFYRKINGELT
ncbi:hypothetical protein Metbo_0829 [Methanobacterium lacus]|uniref:Uncharacterized protein n=1 Tax=Methanobacterium lacus (strain AL-21) TaxID=877455 RepID=F0TBC9_METLA|nr:hypothetical protein [Methanobacterium lacus]ADZ09080.1 hypothetical protein Metbo_0829 [Methanobacterium lacus]